MKIESAQPEVLYITNLPDLDPIHVYFLNIEPGRGYVTITCYGCAWTSWFGAMSGRTIQQFVSAAGTDYLVTKLGITQYL